MQNVLDEQIAIVKEKVGPTAHVICALSGGVDSAVAGSGRAGGPPFPQSPPPPPPPTRCSSPSSLTPVSSPHHNVWPCSTRAHVFSKALKKKESRD